MAWLVRDGGAMLLRPAFSVHTFGKRTWAELLAARYQEGR
jgi:hypothetical protein